MLLANSAFALTIDPDIKLQIAAPNLTALIDRDFWTLESHERQISEQLRQPLEDRFKRVAARRLLLAIVRGTSASARKTHRGAIRFVGPAGLTGTEIQTSVPASLAYLKSRSLGRLRLLRKGTGFYAD